MRTVLIGGTGTLGKCLAEKLTGEVVIFSRGEHQQKAMRARLPQHEYVIGDVRDAGAVSEVVRYADRVFLLAAIKHVDVAQENPLEAIKTNVLGAINVGSACAALGVDRLVFSNTDKAVLPITTYGYSKALARDYLASLRRLGLDVAVYSWGNVLGSQGSVVPLVARAIREGRPVEITDPRMTRFWLRIEDAADFMLNNPESCGDFIPPVRGASLLRVVEAVARVIGRPYRITFTGIRGVEKLHECLETSHEHCVRSDTCPQYSDAELDELVRPIVENA